MKPEDETDLTGRNTNLVAKCGLSTHTTPWLPHRRADAMAWYSRTIDTVDVGDVDATETDRMWRQIDPVLYYTAKRAIDMGSAVGMGE